LSDCRQLTSIWCANWSTAISRTKADLTSLHYLWGCSE
jgi:hypothetical protein